MFCVQAGEAADTVKDASKHATEASEETKTPNSWTNLFKLKTDMTRKKSEVKRDYLSLTKKKTAGVRKVSRSKGRQVHIPATVSAKQQLLSYVYSITGHSCSTKPGLLSQTRISSSSHSPTLMPKYFTLPCNTGPRCSRDKIV